MPVIHRIIILGLIVALLIPSSGIQAWAEIRENEVSEVKNSIEELEQDANIIQSGTETLDIKKDEAIDIDSDITRLIAAKIEYAASETSKIQPVFITNPFEKSETIDLEVPNNAFDNFKELSETPLIESITGSQIKLKRATKKEKRIEGVKGKIGTSLRAGTIIAAKS
jgi:hypothetical protein